jgi:GTP cyclohydrolase I
MTIITNVNDRKSFGDAANLFEAINEDELRNKLEETIQQMYNMFEGQSQGQGASANACPESEEGASDTKSDEFNFFDWAKNMNKNGDGNAEPNANAESIHDHISNILNGKIGKLAKEIAEETAKDVDFGMDFGGESGEDVDFKNVFQKMFKNPGKLMSLVKNVGSKLDQKFKSGEIKESELMQEASDLLSKMKGMPGMNNLADMLNKMGMGGMMGGMGGGGGGKSKVNIGAMQSHLQRNMKVSQMKERMQQKLKAQQQQRDAALAAATQSAASANSHAAKLPQSQVFSTGEVVERTPVEAPRPSNSNKKKKKK